MPTQHPLFGDLPARSKALAEQPLTDWPAGERPATRLRTQGAAALADTELLALVVGGATAKLTAEQLLTTIGGWSALQRASFEELAASPGMNLDRATRLKATLEIGRRMLLMGGEERMQIRSPSDVAQLLMVEMGHLDQEHLRVVCLDTKNRVQKIVTIYIGSLNSSLVRIGEIFKEAIRLNSAAIIIVHNHPSGDPTPSPDDVTVTRQIVEAGKLLDIDVLDHLVIGQGRFVSMRERGLGFGKK